MKLLILTDLHYFTEEEAEKLSELDYFACILLGDINSIYLDMIQTRIKTGKLIYGVYGNHDEPNLLEKRGIANVHGRLFTLGNYTAVGFGGSVRYRNGDFMYTQKESVEIAKKLPKADILFSHDCAFDSTYTKLAKKRKDTAHTGFKGISKYIQMQKPLYNIHGHHHVNQEYQFKKTKCFCLYRCGIFNTITEQMQVIF